MPQLLTCSQCLHQWEASANGAFEGSTVCPICGAEVHTLPLPASPENVDFEADTLMREAALAAEAATLPPVTPTATETERPAVPGYELLEELGRGGMGVVYKARQLRLNRLVALKMVLAGAHAGPQELARFRTEAEAVAQLQHPNIVQIYEIGGTDNCPYLALEFVAGGSLSQKLNGKPLPARDAAQLIETLARAIHAAHQRHIVHRDLKPANILLSFSREPEASAAPALASGSRLNAGVPKITDFGLAKRLDSGSAQTKSGSVLGTPSYMAPEQAGGKSKLIGPATDIYALGAILYELLTGRPPFQAETPLDTVLQVISEEPLPPSRLQPKVPRDLETICLKCLRKEPDQRYASAEALADDLHRFLRGEPIQARPQGRWERGVHWVKRRRELALVCGGALAMVLLFLVLLGLGHLSDWLDKPAPEPQPEPAATLPPDLDLVPRDALGFVSVRVADLWATKTIQELRQQLAQELPDFARGLDDFVTLVEKNLALRPEDVERFTFVLLDPEAERVDNKTVMAILATAQPYDKGKLVQDLVRKRGFKTAERRGKTYYISAAAGPDALVVYPVSNRIVVISPTEEPIRDFLARIPAANAEGPLRGALAVAAEKHHMAAGLSPPRAMRQSFLDYFDRSELLDQPLTEVQTVTLTFNLKSPKALSEEVANLLELDLRLTFPDVAQAKQGEKAAWVLCERLRRDLSKPDATLAAFIPPLLLKDFDSALRPEVEQKDMVVRLLFKLDWSTDHQKALAVGLRDAAASTRSLNNLKQIGVAMHNYEGKYRTLPPHAVSSKDGKPLLSWRVLLLPELEQDNLFKQFKLDEPWDSEHNKKLVAQMPAIYASPKKSTAKDGETFYQVFVGPLTPFNNPKGMSLMHITDGTTNTFLVVEAEQAVPWTKPADLVYDAKKPVPKLGGIFPELFHACYADGSIGRVRKTTAENILRALITATGDDIVPDRDRP